MSRGEIVLSIAFLLLLSLVEGIVDKMSPHNSSFTPEASRKGGEYFSFFFEIRPLEEGQ